MANTTESTHTSPAEFGELPRLKTHLFEVRAGVESVAAVEMAQVLEGCVRAMLSRGVSQDGIDTHELALCDFAMDVAHALRRATGDEG